MLLVELVDDAVPYSREPLKLVPSRLIGCMSGVGGPCADEQEEVGASDVVELLTDDPLRLDLSDRPWLAFLDLAGSSLIVSFSTVVHIELIDRAGGETVEVVEEPSLLSELALFFCLIAKPCDGASRLADRTSLIHCGTRERGVSCELARTGSVRPPSEREAGDTKASLTSCDHAVDLISGEGFLSRSTAADSLGVGNLSEGSEFDDVMLLFLGIAFGASTAVLNASAHNICAA